MKEELEQKLKKLEQEQNQDAQRLQMVNNQKQQLENNLKVRKGKILMVQELLQDLSKDEVAETVEAEA